MVWVRLGAFDGGRAVVWVEVDEVAGQLVGYDVDNGSGRPVGLAEGRGEKGQRAFGAGTRRLVTLPAGERVKLTYDARRGRWDGLDVAMSWG